MEVLLGQLIQYFNALSDANEDGASDTKLKHQEKWEATKGKQENGSRPNFDAGPSKLNKKGSGGKENEMVYSNNVYIYYYPTEPN